MANDTNDNLLYPELSYNVQGAFFEVANKYGSGLKERIYQKALAEVLEKHDITFEEQKYIPIYSLDTGRVLGQYVPDFIVEGKLVIEIKASEFSGKQDVAQQQSYLKASMFEVGYLVNFGTHRLFVRRSIFTNDRKPFISQVRAHS